MEMHPFRKSVLGTAPELSLVLVEKVVGLVVASTTPAAWC